MTHFKMYEVACWMGTHRFAAPSRGKALASAWRSVCSARGDERYTFGQFMKDARCWRVYDLPNGFGDKITVSGMPAYRINGIPGVNNYVTFHRPGEDALLYSHPLDVTEVT